MLWFVRSIVCNLVSFFNKRIVDLSKFIKELLMHIGGNKLNDHNENFSKTSKKCFISNLFLPDHSNYTLAFFNFFSKIYFLIFTEVVCNPQNSKLTFPLACDTLKSHFHQNITLNLKDFIPKSIYNVLVIKSLLTKGCGKISLKYFSKILGQRIL